jgi:hypothetical protein
MSAYDSKHYPYQLARPTLANYVAGLGGLYPVLLTTGTRFRVVRGFTTPRAIDGLIVRIAVPMGVLPDYEYDVPSNRLIAR